MATRFYIDRLITAPVSPTIQAAWTVTSGNTYTMMYPSKSAYCVIAAAATITSGQAGAVAPQKMIAGTIISQPLIAQTILSGSTISMQIRGAKNASTPTCSLIMYVRYCNEDGSNIQEIGNASSTALTTTLTNRTVTLTLGGNVSIADNQRIIIELGGNETAGSVTTLTAGFGSNINTLTPDLPVDNTTIIASTPWIEFSQTLLFRKIGITI